LYLMILEVFSNLWFYDYLAIEQDSLQKEASTPVLPAIRCCFVPISFLSKVSGRADVGALANRLELQTPTD